MYRGTGREREFGLLDPVDKCVHDGVRLWHWFGSRTGGAVKDLHGGLTVSHGLVVEGAVVVFAKVGMEKDVVSGEPFAETKPEVTKRLVWDEFKVGESKGTLWRLLRFFKY